MDHLLSQQFVQLDHLVKAAQNEIEAVKSQNDLEAIRVSYLGKKGSLTDMLKLVGQLTLKEDKIKLGEAVNKAKTSLQTWLGEKMAQFSEAQLSAQLAQEAIDITLPGRKSALGSLHPVMQVRDRIVDIFSTLGFEVAEGPEIETEHYNFEALNIAELHPSRAAQDTFYFSEGIFSDHQNRLLRTHTSPVQIRFMETHEPPIRIIIPGRVYRPDFDATHTPMFHQMEGLVVDQAIHFGHLKAMIIGFLHRFFEREVKVRFRASYFPFTEPSAEVDIQCMMCEGKGCRLCGSGWIEVLGTGMVHPNVLKASGVDPTSYRGLAFGFGIDRLTLLYYKIDDLRIVFENDLRFLQQF